MKVIVCLGNPGDKYHWQRHNIGFLFADFLLQHFSLKKTSEKFKGLLYETEFSSKKVLILKPQTFMNLSGESVSLVLAYYKISFSECLIVYDDIDLPFAKIRYRVSGSAGTHNGMKSVVSCLGSIEIPRLRLGVGAPPEGISLADFVLSNFSKTEREALPTIFKESLSFVETFLAD